VPEASSTPETKTLSKGLVVDLQDVDRDMPHWLSVPRRKAQQDGQDAADAQHERDFRRSLGGPGSGHHGHSGRPGQVGGSAPGKSGATGSRPQGVVESSDFGTRTKDAGKVFVGGKANDELTKMMLDYTVEAGKRDSTEHLMTFDAQTGKILEISHGDNESVEISNDLNDKMMNGEVSVDMHHNHPDVPTSLSDADVLQLAKDGVSREAAHASDGSHFAARRGRYFHPDAVMAVNESAQYVTLQALMMTPGTTTKDLYLVSQHAANSVMHKFGVIDYEYDLSDELHDYHQRMKTDRIIQATHELSKPGYEKFVREYEPWSSVTELKKAS
jgi:hypothetical protein